MEEWCEGRTGQLLNLSSLAADAGIAVNTVKVWLSLLETAWLLVRLPPWRGNISKRIVKSPKLYWLDTSLPCHLLGIRDADDLRNHPLRGAIFENLIFAERYKAATHHGKEPDLSFWRDSAGREVDIIEGRRDAELIWECKSGRTIAQEFFKHLEYYGTENSLTPARRILVHGGEDQSARSAGTAIGWRAVLSGLGGR